uniref:Dynein axonemal assembly factor 10 n=1 Tax=Diabrotica virgifera virgifera TaxID=50390 RepID=A0A6P7G1M6_DIAVI
MEALQRPQIICHNQKNVDYSVHDVKWIPCSAKFVTLGGKSNGSGIVEVYSLTSENVEKVHEFGKKEHFKCGTFEASSLRNRHLATGDFSGRLQVWDLEDPLWPVYKSTAHSAIINSIDGVAGTSSGCGAPEIVTGSRDGSVMVWDVRQKDTPVAKFVPSTEASARDCWSVAFGNSYDNEERVVAAGYDNGDIKLFDLKTMSLRWSKCLKNGVVGIQFDRKNIPMNKLVATTLESKIFCYDVKTKHHKKGFACVTEKAHSSTVWSVKHLPQNRDIFMTTGGAGSLCLWKYTYPDKRVEKDADGIPYGIPGEISCLQNSTLSDQPITSFDWCVDKQGLAVCSAFDQTIRVLIVTKLNLY